METFIIADNIISPIGSTATSNFERVAKGVSGISMLDNGIYSSKALYASGIVDHDYAEVKGYTRFENLCIRSIAEALSETGLSGAGKDIVFILSTTKGNISLIEDSAEKNIKARLSLEHTAQVIAAHFKAANKPVVVSNACISGVVAIVMAKRLLATGKYKHAIVIGADVLSKFIVSGFQSLMAISDEPCRPFDAARKGINLGEAAATVIMTTDKTLADKDSVTVMEGAISNDANHISGPSRTGQELADAVVKAMQTSKVQMEDLSFISAHGTATIYNDEMESKAFDIAGLQNVPLHSLKGYFGHTLGAAGIVESIMTIHSLQNKCILPSKNYEQNGVSKSLNVNVNLKGSDKRYALKTASGFGGCNAAIVYGLNN